MCLRRGSRGGEQTLLVCSFFNGGWWWRYYGCSLAFVLLSDLVAIAQTLAALQDIGLTQ
jgi:hypothetical protein